MTTAHSASRPAVIACRGSAVRTTTSPCGRGPQPGLPAERRAAHPVELLGPPPVRLLHRRAVEPDDALALVAHEPQQRLLGRRPEALGDRVVVVAALVHDQDDVEPVEQLLADAAELLEHPHPEAAGGLQQRREHVRVVPEAPELVVVLDGDPAGGEQDVELPRGLRHASAATDRMYSTDFVVSTAGKYSSPIGPS